MPLRSLNNPLCIRCGRSLLCRRLLMHSSATEEYADTGVVAAWSRIDAALFRPQIAQEPCSTNTVFSVLYAIIAAPAAAILAAAAGHLPPAQCVGLRALVAPAVGSAPIDASTAT